MHTYIYICIDIFIFNDAYSMKTDMYVGITRRVSSLLGTVAVVSFGRQFTPTTVAFSHPRFLFEGVDKKRELLCRVITSRRSTGSAHRVNQYRSRRTTSNNSPALSLERAYSSDKAIICSDSNNEMERDPASDQLVEYKKNLKGDPPVLLTANGAPVANKTASLTVGPRGPVLLQDFVYLDEMSHFGRERIPERVVHAKGAGVVEVPVIEPMPRNPTRHVNFRPRTEYQAGPVPNSYTFHLEEDDLRNRAFGYFEVTHDISQYTKAKVFSGIGKRTPIAVRCSTVGGESGSADTVRDPRGFAVKFYTEEGIWDLVGNNTPIFFVKDPLMFPSFIHTQKRNPTTHLKDSDMFWDFISLRPESTHQVLFLFSDRGIPDGHRHMNGYGSHTFKLVNDRDEMVWCKFHYKTDQGIRNIPADKASQLSATDPDYGIRDLYNAIAKGQYPSWTFSIQVMTMKQAETFRWNPFDVTKVWPHKEYPLIPVGKLVLDRNPANYFADVEQLAFDPAHMPPGIEPSPDKMLQGRLFAYGDTHRHRLGPNHLQLAVNCPYKVFSKTNYQRDGQMTINSQDGAPNYFPNSFNGPRECPGVKSPSFNVAGNVERYDPVNEDDFGQGGTFYRDVLDDGAKTRLVDALVNSLVPASNFIVERAVNNFAQCDINLGKRLIEGLRKAGKAINVSGKSANL